MIHVEQGVPPLVSVDEEESTKIADDAADAPVGLQQAMSFFLVAAGTQNILDPGSRNAGQNFLCHTSQRTTEHARAATLIRNYLNRLSDDLDAGADSTETITRLHWAHDEIKKTMADAPPLQDVLERIKKRLPRRDVPLVNSANSPVEFGRQLNFIVGGNILGRGLTIDNLLVTYYLRRAKVSQMDTVLQHARMFGYRQTLMPFTRVFLPDSLAARFHFIHVAEQNLRQQLTSNGDVAKVTVETMSSLRATRLNVLDTSNLAAYEPGGHIYPGAPDLSDRTLRNSPAVEAAVKATVGGTLKESQFAQVSLEDLIELMQLLPFDEDLANTWDPTRLAQVLARLARRYENQGFVFHRAMRRRKPTLPTGALSGDELRLAREQKGPVLCVFRDDGSGLITKTTGRAYWYPSLVFPVDMATQVFNTTA